MICGPAVAYLVRFPGDCRIVHRCLRWCLRRAGSQSDSQQSLGRRGRGPGHFGHDRQNDLRAGQRIVLSICYKNVGQQEVRVMRGNKLALYDLRIVLPDGTRAPPTLFGKGAFESSRRFARTVGVLKPGEEACVEIELSRLFDMSLAGAYTISAQRAVFKKSGDVDQQFKAESNTVQVRIVEQQDDPAGTEGGHH